MLHVQKGGMVQMAQEEKNLEEAARQARNEYQRKWRAAHKDKVRESNANYWRRRVMKNHGQNAAAQGG